MNEAVSKQHEPALSLRSIPQASSVVAVAPWEQVIKFGELLSWNGSYLPGNWKWVSVMWKECGKIFAGLRETWRWEEEEEEEGDGFMKRVFLCVCSQRERDSVSEKLAVPLDSSSGDGYWCSSSPGKLLHCHRNRHTHANTHTLLHTVLWDSILALKVLGLFYLGCIDSHDPSHSCALVWGIFFSFSET